MGVLQIKDTGFQQMVLDLGIQSPLSGPFFGLEQVVRPVYVLGSSASVRTTTPPFKSADFIYQESANPIVGATWGLTPILPRGRYQFKLNYWVDNQDAATLMRIAFILATAAPVNQFIYTLDLVGNTGDGHNFFSRDMEFCADVLGDDWHAGWTHAGGNNILAGTVAGGIWFHKYADLPTI